MSNGFWIICSTMATFLAASPWAASSYSKQWVDAIFWALAAFCALKAITTREGHRG